jgi:hypothetical protein
MATKASRASQRWMKLAPPGAWASVVTIADHRLLLLPFLPRA